MREEAHICTDLCFARRLHPAIRAEGEEVSLYEDQILPTSTLRRIARRNGTFFGEPVSHRRF